MLEESKIFEGWPDLDSGFPASTPMPASPESGLSDDSRIEIRDSILQIVSKSAADCGFIESVRQCADAGVRSEFFCKFQELADETACSFVESLSQLILQFQERRPRTYSEYMQEAFSALMSGWKLVPKEHDSPIADARPIRSLAIVNPEGAEMACIDPNTAPLKTAMRIVLFVDLYEAWKIQKSESRVAELAGV